MKLKFSFFIYIITTCSILFSTCEKEKITNVTKVTLNHNELTLIRSNTAIFYAKIYPRSADNQTVTWTSSNPDVAAICNDGLVTAISKGKTIITVTTNDCNKQATCNITVIDLPIITTSDASNVTDTNAILGGNITYSGVPEYTERGVCYSTLQYPTIEDNKIEISGIGAGIFSTELTNLIPSTTYYVRAYAINADGTAYGNEESFSTFGIPILTTNFACDILALSATLGGKITNTGTPPYTERGVCYSTTQSPTTTNNKKVATTGTGTGNFSVEVTSLTFSTTYYVRAYAINTEGIAYGNEINFTTVSAFEMVFVQGGTFTMGSFGDIVEPNEKPAHKVTLSSFNIGKYEVTEGEWKTIMGSNPSKVPKGNNYPVEGVSWHDVQEFVSKLNVRTGKNYRLPTEAEWEYAAKGGEQTIIYEYSGGSNINDLAWYIGNSSNGKRTVGTQAPNQLGIYDMSGNVYEWCEDWYGTYSGEEQSNPTGPSFGSNRVMRGGSWNSNASGCRNAARFSKNPNERNLDIGFRLVFP